MNSGKGPRKILRAAIGVATISYVYACEDGARTSGNLVAPPFAEVGSSGAGGTTLTAGGAETSGNLVAPPPVQGGAGNSGILDAGTPDSGVLDAGTPDSGAGPGEPDARAHDAGLESCDAGNGCDAGSSE
jgi:hypothetical protein